MMIQNRSGQKKPVILILGTRLGIVSGVSTHLEQLLGSALREKYQFIHFEIGGQGKQENLWEKLWRFILSPLRLARQIKACNPRLVHFNTSFDWKAFWRDTVYFYLTRLLGRKTVYQVHGGALPGQFFRGNAILTAFLRRFLQIPDALVVLSYNEQREYYQFCRAAQVRVIPNAIDLTPYEGALDKNFLHRPLNLVYLGSLTPDKGLPETIEALQMLKTQVKEVNFRYLLAGSGGMEFQLKKQVADTGLDDVVHFLGPIFADAKIRFWRDAHIFIFPTFREGLPYTLLESLASGTPVITTSVGAIPEVIREGTHGLLVKSRDVSGLYDALKEMTTHPHRLKEMSLSCIRRAHEYYGIGRMTDQFSQLYQFILEGQTEKRPADR